MKSAPVRVRASAYCSTLSTRNATISAISFADPDGRFAFLLVPALAIAAVGLVAAAAIAGAFARRAARIERDVLSR